MKWFSGMATTKEKAILMPPPAPLPSTPAPSTAIPDCLASEPTEPVPKPDEGVRRTICALLNMLVVERLTEAYLAASLAVPRDFKKVGYLLPATGVSSHAEGDLKAKGHVPNTSTFAGLPRGATTGTNRRSPRRAARRAAGRQRRAVGRQRKSLGGGEGLRLAVVVLILLQSSSSSSPPRSSSSS